MKSMLSLNGAWRLFYALEDKETAVCVNVK